MPDLPINYPPARKALFILGLMAIGMAALGAAIGILAGPLGWVLGGPAAVFFGACAWVILYRVVAEAPVLALTEEGVKAWSYPHLEWEEIDFAETATSSEQMFLVIHAKDHDAYLRRFSFLKRQWAMLNASLMQGSVYLSPHLFRSPVAEVARTINAELARHRQNNKHS